MAISFSTLFTRLGKLFGSISAVNTAYSSTLPPHFNSIMAQFSSSDSLLMQQTVSSVNPAMTALENSINSQQILSSAAASVLYQTLQEFAALPNSNIATVIPALIVQMNANGQTVNASSATVAVTTGTNQGNGVLCASTTRADGLNQQNALPEAITGSYTSNGISLVSPATVTALSPLWPGGSGITTTLSITTPTSGSLLSNGGFDSFTVANTPDGWLIGTGTPGTDIVQNVYTVQTITVTGTPTSGTYFIQATDLNGKIQQTGNLAYNATGAQVQSALISLTGFTGATVTSTGTTPNFTHTITFGNMAGDVPVLSVTDNTSGGTHTFTPAIVTHGTSVYTIQTVTTTGTPTSGNYTITVTDLAGRKQTTANIAFNAIASAVQSALRLLNGFGSVTVSESGSTPNFTHTINFIGLAGDVPIISVTDGTSGGTHAITPAIVQHGAQAVNLAIQFVSTGAELTTIYQQITSLKPLTAYCFNGWFQAKPIPAAGALMVELVDGLTGQVINDQQGTPNVLTVTLSGITANFTAQNAFFRTPQVLPALVFIRIRISTAVTSGTTTTIDHCSLVAASSLYTGGPLAAAFSGSAAFAAGNSQIPADSFTVTVTNAQAGSFQTYFDRAFNMKALGVQLPSSGSPTISDSLIS